MKFATTQFHKAFDKAFRHILMEPGCVLALAHPHISIASKTYWPRRQQLLSVTLRSSWQKTEHYKDMPGNGLPNVLESGKRNILEVLSVHCLETLERPTNRLTVTNISYLID